MEADSLYVLDTELFLKGRKCKRKCEKNAGEM